MQRQPLPFGELVRLMNIAAPHQDRDNDLFYERMARLVEAAHGIGEAPGLLPRNQEKETMTLHMTEGVLCEELAAYCNAHGLRHASADDLAADEDTPPEQREWLEDFGRRWDAAMKPDRD